MKTFLLLLQFVVLPYCIKAAKPVADTVPPGQEMLLNELELTEDQKTAMSQLLVDYKLREKRQKKQLRQQMLSVLTATQRQKLRYIRRRKLFRRR
jgi:Spy/CpxP family protein refolding chaperone